jgi:hypothetical protein
MDKLDLEAFLFQKKRERDDFCVGRERVDWVCCPRVGGGGRASDTESALVLVRGREGAVEDLDERKGSLSLLLLAT